LIKFGPSVVGDNKADAGTEWPTTDTNKDYGSSSELWGTTLSVDDVNQVSFGVGVSGVSSGDDDGEAHVDAIWMAIYYTESGGPAPAYEQVSFRFRNDDGGLGAPPGE
jgi:hypothetical protein